MAHILPFRAWRYDQQRVAIEKVVTQPYDKISPAMQEAYYEKSPNNLVRLILGKTLPWDGTAENVYTRAAAAFQDWRQSGVLKQDAEPSIYRYTETFEIPEGATGHPAIAERKSFIALGRLEAYSAEIVYRHEQTHSKPKADRLELLRATRAQLEQIFMLYGGAGKVDALLDTFAPPDIEVTDEYKTIHRVWRVSDPKVIALVQRAMREKKLLIADGHHRYETALAYRKERQSGDETASGLGHLLPYESTMMTFVDMDLPGLVILPTHRLVFGLSAFVEGRFEEDLQNFFGVESVNPAIDAAAVNEMLRREGESGTALLAVTPNRAFLLRKPKAGLAAESGTLSPKQEALDVVQLHKRILEQVLNISEASIRNQENVSYTRDMGDALSQVRSGKAQIAFLMNAARMNQVRETAFAGEVMPQKSTDFYPKLLSGLTIYGLE